MGAAHGFSGFPGVTFLRAPARAVSSCLFFKNWVFSRPMRWRFFFAPASPFVMIPLRTGFRLIPLGGKVSVLAHVRRRHRVVRGLRMFVSPSPGSVVLCRGLPGPCSIPWFAPARPMVIARP